MCQMRTLTRHTASMIALHAWSTYSNWMGTNFARVSSLRSLLHIHTGHNYMRIGVEAARDRKLPRKCDIISGMLRSNYKEFPNKMLFSFRRRVIIVRSPFEFPSYFTRSAWRQRSFFLLYCFLSFTRTARTCWHILEFSDTSRTRHTKYLQIAQRLLAEAWKSETRKYIF